MLVFENHGTYDYVYIDDAKCVTCTYKRQHFAIAGALMCHGECQQHQKPSITYSVSVKSN